jgi:hypothetical protein
MAMFSYSSLQLCDHGDVVVTVGRNPPNWTDELIEALIVS